jgi:oligopeptide transport system substrate-binding protein
MRQFLLAAVAASALMVAGAAAQDTPVEGGTITVTYNDDVATLDPAIGYDWQNWSMIKSLFDGLMDYKPGTTELVPDLAESYEISPDGTVFTFHLRPGVTFQNGRALTSADVKYSIERVVNPATRSPGQGFFGSIQGFAELAAGTATGLSGIATPDDATVVFTLTRPDATFLHVMAINFAHVVPKEAVEEFGEDFGHHPVGTGAYSLAEWTPGQRLVFQKNPSYYHAGLPHLDQIIFEVGQEPSVALLRLENGEVDILGDPIPPARFVDVMANPDYAGQVVEGGQLHTGYLTMNVTMAPFDDVRVRRAVNMAIDKERIVRIINNRAVPANQVLPPSMPGYDAAFAGYPHDVEAAKALMAEAGLADGVDTQLYVMNTDPNPRIAQAIQQDLAAIGIRAELMSLAQASVIEAGGTEGTAPMIWSGGMAWIADFPDPSNFFAPVLGCGGAVPGGWNWSWYCNADLDAKAAAADALVDPAKAEERYAAWSEIYAGVMADAPWAPIFNEQRFTMRSKRMAGPDVLYVDPVHIPIQYDNIWVSDVP